MTQATIDIFEAIVARQSLDDPWDVRVSWRAPEQGDRLVQAYVDQRFAAVTTRSEDRELELILDPSRRRTIELLAVPVPQAGVEMPNLLSSRRRGERHAVTARVMRDEALPAASILAWRIDDQPESSKPVWPRDTHRGGFGGLFGLGAFGFDHATGPGLGRGQLGWGPLDADAEALTLCDESQPAGEHTVSIRLTDDAGREIASPLVQTQRVTRNPEPGSNLRIEAGLLTWE